MVNTPFASSYDHLRNELRRVHSLLHFSVQAHLAAAPEKAERLVGAYLDVNDVQRLLDFTASPEVAFSVGQHPPEELKADFEAALAFSTMVQRRRVASRQAGIPLRLDHLCKIAGLNSVEQDMVLLALLVEVDPNVGQLFGYLNDDLQRRYPTVHSLTQMLATDYESALRMWQSFAPHAPLIESGILAVDNHAYSVALRGVYLSPVVREYLIEHPGLPERLAAVATLEEPQVELADLWLRESDSQRLLALAQQYDPASGSPLLLSLNGLSHSDHKLVAESLARARGTQLLVINLAFLLGQPEIESLLRELTLFAKLNGSVIYLHHLESLASAEPYLLDRWQRLMRQARGLVVMDGQPWNPPSAEMLPLLTIGLAPRDYLARVKLWGQLVRDEQLTEDVDLPAVANTFQLDYSQTAAALEWARGIALWRSGGRERVISQADLLAGCQQQSDTDLAQQARKVQVQQSWEDLVLPEEHVVQLREMVLRIKHQHTVYETWGLKRLAGSRIGLSALFAGPSGTGKTMAAGVIANELGQQLYRIDLSSLVSKYIGETEKNLSRVFDAAERSNAVLFFDEADALFGKRSEVRDSHDRYANIQVAYLLQRMESYTGIAILATNLKANTDDAFVRRLDFIVDFPFPEPEYRERIWYQMLNMGAPVGEVQYGLLAERFRLTGGVIRNAAIHAAFLAAEEGSAIEMRHVLQAVRREYQKMGRLMNEEELLLHA